MILIKILYPIAKLYWKLFRPTTLGVRAFVVRDTKVLLVKPSYLNTWNLPGGGVKKFELAEDAAKRELKEETGYTAKSAELFGVYVNTMEGKFDNITVFLCTDFEEGSANSIEIDEIGWFDFESLPENLYPGVSDRIHELRSNNYPASGKW